MKYIILFVCIITANLYGMDNVFSPNQPISSYQYQQKPSDPICNISFQEEVAPPVQQAIEPIDYTKRSKELYIRSLGIAVSVKSTHLLKNILEDSLQMCGPLGTDICPFELNDGELCYLPFYFFPEKELFPLFLKHCGTNVKNKNGMLLKDFYLNQWEKAINLLQYKHTLCKNEERQLLRYKDAWTLIKQYEALENQKGVYGN